MDTRFGWMHQSALAARAHIAVRISRRWYHSFLGRLCVRSRTSFHQSSIS